MALWIAALIHVIGVEFYVRADEVYLRSLTARVFRFRRQRLPIKFDWLTHLKLSILQRPGLRPLTDARNNYFLPSFQKKKLSSSILGSHVLVVYPGSDAEGLSW